MGAEIVMSLLNDAPILIKVYFDNFFINMNVMQKPITKGICATSMVHLNRVSRKSLAK